MKRKMAYLCIIMLCIAAAGAAFSYAFGTAGQQRTGQGGFLQEASGQDNEEFLVVTSFYPIYIIAENLAEGVEGVRVRNLTPDQTGCLHDYQLTTSDMKVLEQADVLLLNGGGMETFLEKAAANLPELPVISSEEGIRLLKEQSEHDHTHADKPERAGGDGDVHGEYNAHIWLDPARYAGQVRNLAEGMIELDPAHRTAYERNRDAYLEKIEQAGQQYQEAFTGMQEQPVIIFHDAFAYLSEVLPLEVVHAVEIEGDESALSAGEMAEVTEEIELHQIRYLLIEEQYQQTVADVLAAETGTETVILDSLVTGDGGKDDWLDGMRENLEILQKCFAE